MHPSAGSTAQQTVLQRRRNLPSIHHIALHFSGLGEQRPRKKMPRSDALAVREDPHRQYSNARYLRPRTGLVREIAAVIDLSWVYDELVPYYSKVGRLSIDLVLMIRMLIVD
jgi:hypothetical protein